jgi:hypothetical protein
MKTTLRCSALLLLFVFTGSFVASAQLKTLAIGRLTYIGDDPDGDPAFTITLATTPRAPIGVETVQLVTPITFSSLTEAVISSTGTFGPRTDTTVDGMPIVTPEEILFSSSFMKIPAACPCQVVMVQLTIQTVPAGQPTITLALKNGETITTSSTVNAYLTALPGQNAIQLQQFAYINLHAVE